MRAVSAAGLPVTSCASVAGSSRQGRNLQGLAYASRRRGQDTRPNPGKSAVGVEVPNTRPAKVTPGTCSRPTPTPTPGPFR